LDVAWWIWSSIRHVQALSSVSRLCSSRIEDAHGMWLRYERRIFCHLATSQWKLFGHMPWNRHDPF
jgi:hypothetical protein